MSASHSIKSEQNQNRDAKFEARCEDRVHRRLFPSILSRFDLSHSDLGRSSWCDQSTYSSGSVGNASVGDLSCDRAVGNVGSNDLGGVDGTVVVLGNGRGSESCEGEDGELHFEGWW